MQALIVTLAEYQTLFWVNVARALKPLGIDSSFLSFDDRSVEMIAAAGFPVVSASTAPALESFTEQAAVFARAGISRLAELTVHERFAFNRADTAEMHRKLARAVVAAEEAIEAARQRAGDVVMVQEVGGFLSVIGSFHAARSAGVDNWFIEPSFFRGRMLLTMNDFAAPRIGASSSAREAEMLAYVEETLAAGSIVIPVKDAHHYSSAVAKVMNLRNLRRLGQKLVDKYLLRKRHEFGFIGHHVRTHLTMVSNSRKLQRHYTPLDQLDGFVYYPLHVPADMALTLRSPEYLDQLALIDYLCRSLPDGFRLAVKEHPAMVGAISADRMIELLKRYDSLALLPPTTNNYSVMRRARAIVTVNSKSGAEAGLLGKRVLVLGDAFYRDAPFAIPVADLTELKARLAEEVASESADLVAPAHLDWFSRVWEQSLPGELFVTDKPRAELFARSLAARITQRARLPQPA